MRVEKVCQQTKDGAACDRLHYVLPHALTGSATAVPSTSPEARRRTLVKQAQQSMGTKPTCHAKPSMRRTCSYMRAQNYAQQSHGAQGMTHLSHAGRLSDRERGGVPRGARQAGDQVQHRSGDGDRRLAVPGLQLAAHGPVAHRAPSAAPAHAVQDGADARVHTGKGKEVAPSTRLYASVFCCRLSSITAKPILLSAYCD